MLPVESDEIKKLLEQLNQLKNDLAELLEERDFLTFYEAGRLEAEYMKKIGHLEYEVFMLDLKLKKLQRKVHIVREKIANGDPIDMAAINKQVEEEFSKEKKEQTQYEERIEVIEEEEHQPKLSKENTKTLKEMYYQLVKKLHPDLNPDLTEAQLALWYRVQKAYEEKDLEEMTKLYELYQDVLDINVDLTQKDEIIKRIERARELIRQTLMQIAEIKTVFPFTFERELKDEDWLFGKTAINRELKRQIKNDYGLLQDQLRMMLQSVGIMY